MNKQLHLVGTMCLAAAIIALVAPSARADLTIAEYHFDPGANFLTDFSGNGYNLTGTADQSNDVANLSGGTGSAYFNGSQGLVTIAPLDFTGVTHLRLSFALRAFDTSTRVILETTSNFNSNPGAFLFDVNESGSGFGNFGYKTTSSYNIEKVPHAINNTAWDLFQVDIIPGANAANVI
jgi:hypothetical protein